MFTLMVFPSVAFAQVTTIIPESGGDCDYGSGKLDWSCFPLLVGRIVEFIIGFIGTLCLLEIIVGGFQIMIGSTGIPGVGDKGKTRIINAIVGLLISILAFAIVNIFVSTTTS
jgi:hypothetical protein